VLVAVVVVVQHQVLVVLVEVVTDAQKQQV
jgi:hypothetical protein